MRLQASLPSFVSCIALSAFVSGCAGLEQQLHAQGQALEDSIRGYRVQYESMPAGAKIFCSGNELGTAPFLKYRDLGENEKRNGQLHIQGCEAVWNSGARASIDSIIPLSRFPRFVYLVAERPVEAPGAQADDEVGVNTLAARQKVLDDLAVATGNLVALGIGIREARNASKYAVGTPFYTPSNRQFKPIAGNGNIRWNWVQSSTPAMPDLQSPIGGSGAFGSHATLTPMYPASSCIGTIVSGQCVGKILATEAPTGICGGKVVQGRCYGSILMGN